MGPPSDDDAMDEDMLRHDILTGRVEAPTSHEGGEWETIMEDMREEIWPYVPSNISDYSSHHSGVYAGILVRVRTVQSF